MSCIHVLSFACIFLSFCFHLLSEVMEMVLLLGQGTGCNKWLSLNNLSKSPPTYDIVRQIFFHENDRQRDRESERKKRARKRERESKRVNLVVRNSKALKSNLQSRGGIVHIKPPMKSQDLIGHSVRGVTYL